jgi:hypothetical protein
MTVKNKQVSATGPGGSRTSLSASGRSPLRLAEEIALKKFALTRSGGQDVRGPIRLLLPFRLLCYPFSSAFIANTLELDSKADFDL